MRSAQNLIFLVLKEDRGNRVWGTAFFLQGDVNIGEA